MSSPHPATTPNHAKKLLTQQGLHDLRAQLFRLELTAMRRMITQGADATNISVLADLDRAIEAVERLQLPARKRS